MSKEQDREMAEAEKALKEAWGASSFGKGASKEMSQQQDGLTIQTVESKVSSNVCLVDPQEAARWAEEEEKHKAMLEAQRELHERRMAATAELRGKVKSLNEERLAWETRFDTVPLEVHSCAGFKAALASHTIALIAQEDDAMGEWKHGYGIVTEYEHVHIARCPWCGKRLPELSAVIPEHLRGCEMAKARKALEDAWAAVT